MEKVSRNYLRKTLFLLAQVLLTVFLFSIPVWAVDQSTMNMPTSLTVTQSAYFNLNITGAKGTDGSSLSGVTAVNVTSDNALENLSSITSVTLDSKGDGSIPVNLTQTGAEKLTVTLAGVTTPAAVNVTVEDPTVYDHWKDYTGTLHISGYSGAGGNLIIPSTLFNCPVYFDYFAFQNCTSLTSVDIQDGVTSINNGVFNTCTNLTSVNIPASVTSIGILVFTNCSHLSAINVDINNSSYKSIDGVLFTKDGTNLIQFPPAKTEISYEIPNGVTNIGDDAFRDCSNLTSVDIPASVTSISAIAFTNCSHLSEINADINNSSYKSIDGVLFTKDGTKIIRFPSAKTETSYEIPNGVTSIDSGAFENCTSLTSVDFPTSTTNIRHSAFLSCTNLTRVDIPAGVIVIYGSAFKSCANLARAYFYGNAPAMQNNAFLDTAPGFTIYYVNGTSGWTNPWHDNPTIAVYPITFDSQGGISVATIFALPSTPFSAPAAPTKEGYTFNGWYQDADCNTPWDFSNDTISAATTLYAGWTPCTYTITFDPEGGTVNPTSQVKKYGSTYGKAADGITDEALPTPIKTGSTFDGWYDTNSPAGDRITNTTTVSTAHNQTLYAQWTPEGGDDSQPPVPTTSLSVAKATLTVGSSQESINLSTDENQGIVLATLDAGILNKAFEKVLAGSDGRKTLKLDIPKVDGMNFYEVKLPASAFSSDKADQQIKISNEFGSITLPDNMLTGTGFENAGDVRVSMGKADKSKLPRDIQEKIGDKPVIELKLIVGDKTVEWNNPDAPVTVSIPFTPTTQELADPEHIVVWYIDGSGNAVSVPSGRYDPQTGMVTFTTTHFSYYAAVYVEKTFNDLDSVSWAQEKIEILASKGILKGMTEQEYAPQASITRADFLYSLVRTLGAETVVDGNFEDIKSDAYYYREIAIAKKLGITSGTGNNRFNPDESITRQDMLVLTGQALSKLGKQTKQGTASNLERFTDHSLIADYAIDSVATMVKEGLIEGSGSQINPRGNTTRAEAAVFLYRIFKKF